MFRGVGISWCLSDCLSSFSLGAEPIHFSYVEIRFINSAVFRNDWMWEHRNKEWVRYTSGHWEQKTKIQIDTRANIQRLAEGPRGLLGMSRCWHQQRQGNIHREGYTSNGGWEEEERGGAKKREGGGGGDKNGGTTLVIRSLATVGWVDVINRNCSWSRELLMALNLHQTWAGRWREEKVTGAACITLHTRLLVEHARTFPLTYISVSIYICVCVSSYIYMHSCV